MGTGTGATLHIAGGNGLNLPVIRLGEGRSYPLPSVLTAWTIGLRESAVKIQAAQSRIDSELSAAGL
jgi:hypothetical protein